MAERYTQDDRIVSITTPLGKDFLLFDSMHAREAISELFSFAVEVRHQEDTETGAPTEIKPEDILGKGVTVTITQLDDTKRFFNGIVCRFIQSNRERRFTYYRMELVPQHWLLTQIRQSRIFQNKSVPDILRDVLTGLPYKIEVQGTFKPRNYCVQYRESDFDFISRLMEEEGIFYYFEHSDGKHNMIIANDPQSHRDCPSKSTVRFAEERVHDMFQSVVSRWLIDFQLQTGKVAFWDHKFELPTKKLDVMKESQFSAGEARRLESYDYPGGYARKYDGIDSGGGESASNLQNIFDDNKEKAKIAIGVLDSRFRISKGESDCASFTAGHRFTLEMHPIPAYDGKYVLTSIQHGVHQSPGYVSDDLAEAPYTNQFECITLGAGAPPFRPLPKTAKPIVMGSQTAMVVGPSGEEIFTDKYGRVKVQFHWDRHGKNDSASSCWVRVAQDWAGKKWGTMFIPRIGMEVVVDFLEGDPDQPIIVGSVYNAETMPPYTLPDEKTKSTIKTNSTTGGGGFNELRFEDKKGSEQIFIHGEKDLDIRIKNDKKEIIGNDRHLVITKNTYSEVKGDSHSKTVGDNNEEIQGSKSLKVSGSIDIKSDGKTAIEANGEIHIKSAIKVIIEAPQVSLKGAGGFVDVGPGGVTISGTMVKINSGGAAGSGGGIRITTPTAPKEPVTAEGGKSGGAVSETPAPPGKSDFQSPEAGAQSGAADSGTPTTGSPAGGPPEQQSTSDGGSGGSQAGQSGGGGSPVGGASGGQSGGSPDSGSAGVPPGGGSGGGQSGGNLSPGGGAGGGQSGGGSPQTQDSGSGGGAGGGQSGGGGTPPSGGTSGGGGAPGGGSGGGQSGGNLSPGGGAGGGQSGGGSPQTQESEGGGKSGADAGKSGSDAGKSGADAGKGGGKSGNPEGAWVEPMQPTGPVVEPDNLPAPGHGDA